jgi:hypothetical protein
MSQENVELVRQLQPGQDMDLAHLVRDERLLTGVDRGGRPLSFTRTLSAPCVGSTPTRPTYPDLDGMRTGWLDWRAPWVQYRTEVENVLDAGDRVLVLTRDFGRREGSNRVRTWPSAALVWPPHA